jgi:hypothetical protein
LKYRTNYINLYKTTIESEEEIDHPSVTTDSGSAVTDTTGHGEGPARATYFGRYIPPPEQRRNAVHPPHIRPLQYGTGIDPFEKNHNPYLVDERIPT